MTAKHGWRKRLYTLSSSTQHPHEEQHPSLESPKVGVSSSIIVWWWEEESSMDLDWCRSKSGEFENDRWDIK